MIFDTISVKARWERWCRWNCDLRVINAQKKAFSVVPKASPWRPNHVTICLLRHSGESLQNGQLELRRRNRYFVRETHKDTAVSVWACQTARCDKWWDAECRGVLMCDVECYVKRGRGMWRQLGVITVRCGGIMQLCKMRNAVQLNCVKCGGCGREVWPI